MTKVIYCDGAYNKKTAPYAWGSLVDENGTDLVDKYREYLKMTFPKNFSLKDVTTPNGKKCVILCRFKGVEQQNNGAELMSFISALLIANINGSLTIYCDSELIVKWWSNGRYNSRQLDQEKIKHIIQATTLRKEFEEKGGKVVSIRGKDNLADLGWHYD